MRNLSAVSKQMYATNKRNGRLAGIKQQRLLSLELLPKSVTMSVAEANRDQPQPYIADHHQRVLQGF